MSQVTRRGFLKGSLAAGGAFAIGVAGREVLGANDVLNVGIAGFRSQGGTHLSAFLGMKDARVTWLIDPDRKLHGGRVKECESKRQLTPKTTTDIRKALEDKDLNIISTASPNHWHALITVWSCQAGKDVYVEKPCSHNVFEGRKAVEAARKYGRIVQHGTQKRSGGGDARVAAVIASGQLGKLILSHGWSSKGRGSIGVKPIEQPWPELDFDIWRGPAPASLEFHRNLVHYNWHWFWATGCGEIGNQGVHEMDVARWGIPGATLPKSVISLGGRFGYKDQAETPNSQLTLFDFGDGRQLIFENRGLKLLGGGQKIYNNFFCEKGAIIKGKFFPAGSKKAEPLPEVDVKLGPGGGKWGNFMAAVRSRKHTDLNADILEGHYSSALCHLGNISYRLGTDVPFNPRTKAFGDDKAAYDALMHFEDYLKHNGLKLEAMTYRLGRKLDFDPETERFVGDAEANALLTRDYRKPFVVPDKV